MLIAQITDMHVKPEGEMLSGTLDSFTGLADAVGRINALDPLPDLVVATGDLTADGERAEYAALRRLLERLEMRYLLIPGNHDIREYLGAAFADQPWRPTGEYLHYAVDDYPLRLVALDTLVPGSHAGLLDESRLSWLDKTLGAAPDQPTVILMHHPPFATGIGPMDRMGLENSSGFAAVAERHKQIVRILCGHIHRPVQALVAGIPASVAPSTSFQVELVLHSEREIQWTREPPAFQLHAWTAEGGMVSHTVYVTDYGGLERPGHYRKQA